MTKGSFFCQQVRKKTDHQLVCMVVCLFNFISFHFISIRISLSDDIQRSFHLTNECITVARLFFSRKRRKKSIIKILNFNFAIFIRTLFSARVSFYN